jgi:hypothetical protein
MVAALSSSAVNSTGGTHGMAAGGIGIRGHITDIGTGILTDHRCIVDVSGLTRRRGKFMESRTCPCTSPVINTLAMPVPGAFIVVRLRQLPKWISK